jgi:hypothetical protein
MTRRSGGVVETCQHMEFVRMTTRRIAIEGEWFTIQFFKEEDNIRVEIFSEIKNKFYKMYPDNKIGGLDDTWNEKSES